MPAITVHSSSPINKNTSSKPWGFLKSKEPSVYCVPTSAEYPDDEMITFINPFGQSRKPMHRASNSWSSDSSTSSSRPSILSSRSESVYSTSSVSEGPRTPQQKSNPWSSPFNIGNPFRKRTRRSSRTSVSFASEPDVHDDDSVSPRTNTFAFDQNSYSERFLSDLREIRERQRDSYMGGKIDLSSPPGYRQNFIDSFEDRHMEVQRTAMVSPRMNDHGGILDHEPIYEEEQDEHTWAGTVSWAAAAGRKLSAAGAVAVKQLARGDEQLWKGIF